MEQEDDKIETLSQKSKKSNKSNKSNRSKSQKKYKVGLRLEPEGLSQYGDTQILEKKRLKKL